MAGYARAAGVFAGSLAFLLMLSPSAPFTKELGVLESSAVRDIFAGHVILPSFAPYEPGSDIQAPPLSWWTDAIMVRMLGWNELAFRLPEIIASAATCALLFLWLTQFAGYRAGLWGAAALLLCHYFADAARQPRMDAMLTMFATASIICLQRALSGARGRRRRSLISAAILMALGTMTKGPLGLLLPALVLGAYCLVTRRWRDLLAPDLAATFIGALALVIPWYVAAYRVGGERFLQWQIYGVLFHRFASANIGGHLYCPNPFYYFLPITLAGFFPWSLYLPALGIRFWRRRGSLGEPAVFALCWFAVIFLFFSWSAGKCFVYILPAFPGLAASMGLLIDHMYDRRRDALVARAFGAASAILGIGGLLLAASMVLVLAAGLPALSAHLHPKDRKYLEVFHSLAGHPSSAFFLTVWTVSAFLLLLGWRRTSLNLQLGGLMALAAAGIAFWLGVMNPALSNEESLKGFAQKADRLVPAAAEIDFIGQMDYDFAFYSTHSVGHARNFDCRALERGQRYFMANQEEYGKLNPLRTGCLDLIAKSKAVDRRGERLLLTLHPGGAAAQADFRAPIPSSPAESPASCRCAMRAPEEITHRTAGAPT